MENSRNQLFRFEKYVVAICLLFCGLFSFPNYFSNITSGIDESWVFALNMSTKGGEGFVFGKDLFFNYGPLGFLQHPQNVNSNLFWGVIIWGAIWLLNILLLIQIYKEFSYNLINTFFVILGTYLYAIIQFNAGDEYICYIGLLLLTLIWKSNKEKYYFLFFWILFSISFMYKFSSFMELAFSMLCFVILLCVIKRKIKSGVIFFCGSVISPVLGYLIYNPSIIDLCNYIKGFREVSAGYSATMGVNYSSDGLLEHLNGNVFWLVIGGVALLTLAILLIITDKSGWIMLMFLVVLPVAYKHEVIILSGAGFYEGGMLTSVAFMTLDWNSYISALNSKICKKTVFVCVWSIMLVIGLYYGGLFGRAGMMLNKIVFKFPSNILNCIYEDGRHADKLPERIKECVKDGTVCLYPYELTAIYDDEINGVFMPTLQQYNGYTPWLDQKDADFFAKENAPEYLVIRWYDHAYRFPFIETPRMWEAIINNYSFVLAEGDLLVLKRIENQIEKNELQIISTENYDGQIEINPDAKYLSIDMEISLWGKIKGLFWKNDEVDLLVFTKDGNTIAGRVTPQVISYPFPINYIVNDSEQLIQELSGNSDSRALSFSLQGKGLKEFKNIKVRFYK